MRSRLARLEARERLVLEAAALLGRRFGWRLLAPAAGVTEDVVAAALHRAMAAQLVLNDGDGFMFRHALTRDVVLAALAPPARCRLSLAAAEALAAAGAPAAGGAAAPATDGSRAMLLGRLLADGGQPARAAGELLMAGHQALAAGDFASAELLIREAEQIAGTPGIPGDPKIPDDLRVAVAGELAQVLLQAGQPAEAAGVAARTAAAADGRDPVAATAMRLILARAAAMTARWDDARSQLDDIRRAGVAAVADPQRARDRGNAP